jgi:predicted RNA-binding Zn ribbon-like protein
MLVRDTSMAETASHEFTFELSGGRLCLDFVNTVGGMRERAPKEHLARYADLLAFARQTGIVDAARARRLQAEARRRPGDADAVLLEALALREALYRIFLARARHGPLAPADVARLDAALGRALAHRRLARAGDAWTLGWDDAPDALDAPLWPVIESAAALLTDASAIGRVRVCGMYEDEECSWLFVDETRAGTRRWCSMQDCGNRAKARRHYRRHREEGGG